MTRSSGWNVHLAVAIALVLTLAACGEDHLSAPVTVITTEDGALNGITSPNVNQFLGIPYAEPPVGALRWTPPQPHGAWKGVLEATQVGNPCPQLDSLGKATGDEDCLSLNVYTPGLKKPQSTQNGLAVMVWIPGGSLTHWSGGMFDPTPLVEKGDVIVVTINYRLGVLGWFAHPALDAEDHLKANYGLMDQQFALRWVQRNIAAFGGDPDRVTIFGESAGGLSVYCNLASPTAAGLFHRAIAESGAYSSFESYLDFIVPLAAAEPGSQDFAASVGCGDQSAQCLRATPAASLILAPPDLLYPFIDGTLLTETPPPAFASGQFNQVPVISGTNHDEYRLQVALAYDYAGHPLTSADYPKAVADLLRLDYPDPTGSLDLALGMYPLSKYPPPPPYVEPAPLALAALGTDLIYACPARRADQLLSQYVPTYAYEFSDENAPLNLGYVRASFPLGAYHNSEMQYLFNLLGTAAPFTSDQQQLSDAMIGYWAQFAKSGDPNQSGAPDWPPYDASTHKFQSLVPPTPQLISNFANTHKCTFWDSIGGGG